MTNYEERKMNFSRKLIEFLENILGDEKEEVCRFCASLMMYESANILYQNSPNKTDFDEKAKQLFSISLKHFNEHEVSHENN